MQLLSLNIKSPTLSSLLFRLTDLREDATEKQLSHNVYLDETFLIITLFPWISIEVSFGKWNLLFWKVISDLDIILSVVIELQLFKNILINKCNFYMFN